MNVSTLDGRSARLTANRNSTLAELQEILGSAVVKVIRKDGSPQLSLERKHGEGVAINPSSASARAVKPRYSSNRTSSKSKGRL